MQLTATTNVCPRCGSMLRVTNKGYHICNNCAFDECRIKFMMSLLGYKYVRIKGDRNEDRERRLKDICGKKINL